ncbi:MAG: hypothetical protein V1918_10840 [Planctomycetota bacterium]
MRYGMLIVVCIVGFGGWIRAEDEVPNLSKQEMIQRLLADEARLAELEKSLALYTERIAVLQDKVSVLEVALAGKNGATATASKPSPSGNPAHAENPVSAAKEEPGAREKGGSASATDESVSAGPPQEHPALNFDNAEEIIEKNAELVRQYEEEGRSNALTANFSKSQQLKALAELRKGCPKGIPEVAFRNVRIGAWEKTPEDFESRRKFEKRSFDAYRKKIAQQEKAAEAERAKNAQSSNPGGSQGMPTGLDPGPER